MGWFWNNVEEIAGAVGAIGMLVGAAAFGYAAGAANAAKDVATTAIDAVT